MAPPERNSLNISGKGFSTAYYRELFIPDRMKSVAAAKTVGDRFIFGSSKEFVDQEIQCINFCQIVRVPRGAKLPPACPNLPLCPNDLAEHGRRNVRNGKREPGGNGHAFIIQEVTRKTFTPSPTNSFEETNFSVSGSNAIRVRVWS